jgi:hypothetical protein
MWDSLTGLGKLVVLGAVALGLLLAGLAYGGGGGDSNPRLDDIPLSVRSTAVAPALQSGAPTVPSGSGAPGVVPTAASAPSGSLGPQPTAPATATSAQPTATPASATDTPRPAATPVPAPPTSTPVVPSPTPPQPTPTPSCSVSASVANSPVPPAATQSVTGVLSCASSPVRDAPMTAVWNFPGGAQNCSAPGDSTGRATCSLRTPTGSSGITVTVSVCFNHQAQVYCGQTGFQIQ